jgi:hypothetical protein
VQNARVSEFDTTAIRCDARVCTGGRAPTSRFRVPHRGHAVRDQTGRLLGRASSGVHRQQLVTHQYVGERKASVSKGSNTTKPIGLLDWKRQRVGLRRPVLLSTAFFPPPPQGLLRVFPGYPFKFPGRPARKQTRWPFGFHTALTSILIKDLTEIDNSTPSHTTGLISMPASTIRRWTMIDYETILRLQVWKNNLACVGVLRGKVRVHGGGSEFP